MRDYKKAQEEIVGFALILIVTAVMLLIFLVFSAKNNQKEAVESYEIESFVQSMLQYTTDCRDFLEPLDIQKTISKCKNKNSCVDGRDSCDVLNSELKSMLEESWIVNSGSSVKGYELKIISSGEEMSSIKKGNETLNSKSAAQFFQDVKVYFTAYY